MGARGPPPDDDLAHDAGLVHHGCYPLAGHHHGYHVQKGEGKVWTGFVGKSLHQQL